MLRETCRASLRGRGVNDNRGEGETFIDVRISLNQKELSRFLHNLLLLFSLERVNLTPLSVTLSVIFFIDNLCFYLSMYHVIFLVNLTSLYNKLSICLSS